ncbi:hypothetical protein PSFL111601_05840 [Pseudomonas floridensis]
MAEPFRSVYMQLPSVEHLLRKKSYRKLLNFLNAPRVIGVYAKYFSVFCH